MSASAMSLPKFVLITFIFYVVASIAALMLGILQPAIRIPDVVISLAQFGPTIAVLAVLLLFRGKNRPKIATGLSLEGFVTARILVALGLAAVIFGMLVAIHHWLGRPIDFTPPSTLSQPFLIILFAQVIGAAGEELGWRGFLQPFFLTRMSVTVSSIGVGLLWGLWHIAVFSYGLAYAGYFILSAVAISVILGELLRGARGNNIIIAAVFHAAINIGLLLLFTEEGGSVFEMAAFALVCAAIAIIATLWPKRSLVS